MTRRSRGSPAAPTAQGSPAEIGGSPGAEDGRDAAPVDAPEVRGAGIDSNSMAAAIADLSRQLGELQRSCSSFTQAQRPITPSPGGTISTTPSLSARRRRGRGGGDPPEGDERDDSDGGGDARGGGRPGGDEQGFNEAAEPLEDDGEDTAVKHARNPYDTELSRFPGTIRKCTPPCASESLPLVSTNSPYARSNLRQSFLLSSHPRWGIQGNQSTGYPEGTRKPARGYPKGKRKLLERQSPGNPKAPALMSSLNSRGKESAA